MAKIDKQEIKIVQFYYFPFVLDVFLRWLTLGFYRSLTDTHDASDFGVFIVGQLLITALTAFFVLYRFHKIKEHYDFLQKDTYEEKISIFSIVFRGFVVFSVGYIIYNVITEQAFYRENFTRNNDGSQLFIPVIVLLLYAAFVFFLSLKSIAIPQRLQILTEDYTERPSLFASVMKFFKSKASENTSKISLNKIENTLLSDTTFLIDRNDYEIVELEGRVRNEMTRVDAYILESVMFGALAFSGFLSIIASERFNLTLSEKNALANQQIEIANNLVELPPTKEKSLWISIPTKENKKENTSKVHLANIKTTEIRVFWNDLVLFLDNVLLFDLKNASKQWRQLVQPQNLIMIIMIETLFCALFFLSVIASRLRYSRMNEEIDNLIRLARSFNDKEEEVYNIKLQGNFRDEKAEKIVDFRLEVLSAKIAANLDKVRLLQLRTKPILLYMSLLRNSGVVTFLLVLITSCLYFSETLASIFLLLTTIAYLYESLDIKLRMNNYKQNTPKVS